MKIIGKCRETNGYRYLLLHVQEEGQPKIHLTEFQNDVIRLESERVKKVNKVQFYLE
jgi:hypothetical protein